MSRTTFWQEIKKHSGTPVVLILSITGGGLGYVRDISPAGLPGALLGLAMISPFVVFVITDAWRQNRRINAASHIASDTRGFARNPNTTKSK